MDHPASLQRELPWRTTAMVAAGVAALECVLLVLLGTALLAKPILSGGGGGTRENTPAARAETPAPQASGARERPAAPAVKLTRAETSVMVLNGNGSSGAASEKADLVQSRGYLITGTANAPRTDFARSVVMFRPGYEGEARRLARDFRIQRVTPLDGLGLAELQGAHIALIVGES
jgi:LytR cell envelope-related transcriptional attenuator